MDAMGMGLCVAFIAFVRLPSLKVSTLLLSGLLLYDVFWVFFSQYVFSANVMVKVSTTGFSSQIGTKLRDLAVGQAWGSCYYWAALSSNDPKTRICFQIRIK